MMEPESWRPGSFSPNRLAPPAPAGGAFLCFVSPALDGRLDELAAVALLGDLQHATLVADRVSLPFGTQVRFRCVDLPFLSSCMRGGHKLGRDGVDAPDGLSVPEWGC